MNLEEKLDEIEETRREYLLEAVRECLKLKCHCPDIVVAESPEYRCKICQLHARIESILEDEENGLS